MHFENYLKSINSIKDIKTFVQLPLKKQKQNRFAVMKNMFLEEMEKSKFAQINDKRY